MQIGKQKCKKKKEKSHKESSLAGLIFFTTNHARENSIMIDCF